MITHILTMKIILVHNVRKIIPPEKSAKIHYRGSQRVPRASMTCSGADSWRVPSSIAWLPAECLFSALVSGFSRLVSVVRAPPVAPPPIVHAGHAFRAIRYLNVLACYVVELHAWAVKTVV